MALCSMSFTELNPELLVNEQLRLWDHITKLTENTIPATV